MKSSYWKKTYSPFHFNFLAIAPRSKEGYPRVNAWKAFDEGANIAVQYDGLRHVTVDVDTSRPTPFIRKIMNLTLSWKTPKGYGMAFDGPVSQEIVDAFFALGFLDRNLWSKLDNKSLNFGFKIREKLTAAGITDKTAVHGIFKHLDGLSYVLVPPSTTCKYQGSFKDKVAIPRVRQHSSHLSFCNNSPTGKHVYVIRMFFNYTTKLMKFNDFITQLLEHK